MNIEETRNEIIGRTIEIKKNREKKNLRMLQWTECALVALLVMVIQLVPKTKIPDVNNGYYGTLALGPETGAYIIVGIICFLLGVVITLIAKRTHKDNKTNRGDKDEE